MKDEGMETIKIVGPAAIIVSLGIFNVHLIFSPILITLGIIGNSLSIAVLTRRSMRSSSASVYLIALALADITVLLCGPLRHFIRYIAGIDVRDISNFGCKVNALLLYASLDTSVWILVAFTFERILAVFTPHKVKSYCSRMSSIIVIAGVVVVMMAYNGHMLYGFGYKVILENDTNGLSNCDFMSTTYKDFFLNILPWLDFGVYSFVPCLVLIIGNSCIAVRVLTSEQKTRKISTMEMTLDCASVRGTAINLNQRRGLAAPSRSVRNSSMTFVLLALNLVFLVTTVPVGLFAILEPGWTRQATTDKETKVIDLVYAVVNLIMYINNSINFILYCVTGTRFRRELVNVFTEIRKWMRLGAVKVSPFIQNVVVTRPRLTAASPETLNTPI